MKNFRFGSTRVVLLVGRHAVKVARIRPLRLLLRLPFLALSRRQRGHFLAKYGPGALHAAVADVFAGILANRGERSYYARSADKRVAPSTSILLGGFVLLQERGEDVSAEELMAAPPLGCAAMATREARDPHQYCRFRDGAIRLVDYGSPETLALLATS